ncbi:MAG: DNA translocase FtsK, partial [Anaerolineae bacterium]
GQGGGLAGWLVGSMPGALLGDLITSVLLVVLALLGLWLAVRPLGLPSIDWQSVGDHLRPFWQRLLPDHADAEPLAEASPPAKSQPSFKQGEAALDDPTRLRPSIAAEEPRPKRKRPARQKPQASPIKPQPRPDYLPPLELLASDAGTSAREADIQYKTQVIEQTLASFSVPVTVVDVNVGPAVTQFGVKPGYLTRRGADGRTIKRRVRVSRIKSLTNDLALALEAPTLRIEAPVPGKGYVGIEVPNSDTDLVRLKAVLESQAFLRIKSPLAFGLGRDVSGEPVAGDLATMPHLLIAGATGSGKSVCINSLVASLLFNNGPDQLRLLLMDPKRVELAIYNDVPHLVSPVVVDIDQVVGALTWLALQMDERYRTFSRVGARHIKDYNRKMSRKRKPAAWRDLEPYPYLVLVIDELADLMMAAPDQVEYYVCRLAQMARATGIHLVIATQRPSVDVVTGLIKANFPARIAFSVTSQTDIRLILDTQGADQLIGRGDMLFTQGNDTIRLQCAYVDTPEVAKITEYIGSQRGYPDAHLLPEYVGEDSGTGIDYSIEERDDMFREAAEVIVAAQQGSASLIQRKLKLGYNRAGRIIDQLEAAGIVGPFEGSKARQVLVPDMASLEQLLNNESN